MNRIFTVLAVCAAFVAGSIGGCGAANRYQLVPRGSAVLRIDQLTGKTWVLRGASWFLFKEIATVNTDQRDAEAYSARQRAAEAARQEKPPKVEGPGYTSVEEIPGYASSRPIQSAYDGKYHWVSPSGLEYVNDGPFPTEGLK